MRYSEDIYRLAYIKRYSNVPKLHEESVAEHGFFVAALLLELHDHYKFDLGRALILAIAHDLPEMELNDCPHIIKKKYPAIKEAYDVCESEVAQQLPPAARNGVIEFDAGKSIEARIAHLADAMQCIQFSQVEVGLGNVGYMKVVYDNSVIRVAELKKELMYYER